MYNLLKIFHVVCFSLLLGLGWADQGLAKSTPDEPAVINITAEGKLLNDIIREVSAQTGYTIEISESLLSQKVTGRFRDVDIDSFFRRVFKGSNIFQITDSENQTIKVYSTLRKGEKTYVVSTDDRGRTSQYMLDGEPGKSMEDLLRERDEAYENYDPSRVELDGEPGKTQQDLLDERELAYQNYNPSEVKLDDDSGKTHQDLLNDRDLAAQSYNPSEVQLDEQPGLSHQDLLDARAEAHRTYDPRNIELDGEPGKTLQDLLDERNN